MTIKGFNQILVFISMAFLLSSCGVLKSFQYKDSNKKDDTSVDAAVDATMVTRTSVTEYSKQYVGVKYKYAGKDPKGFDCSGFTSYVLQSEGINISSSSKVQATEGKPVPLNKVKPGDLIFFGKHGKVTHVGLVVSNTAEGITVIHSTSSKGVMVQNVSQSSYWEPKIMFARDVISP